MRSRRLAVPLALGGVLSITSGAAGGQARPSPQSAVIFDNGPLVTHPGGGAGGADASALHSGMQTYGFGAPLTADRLADDFTVPAGAAWYLDSVVLYAYQIGASVPNPTIDHVNLRIWDGPPGGPGSNVIHGDASTNRLARSEWSSIYRVPIAWLLDSQRPIYANTVTLGVTLPAGTYWLDWQARGSVANGPWSPPVTILGQTTTGDALRLYNGLWIPATDIGPQGLPFRLNGPTLAPLTMAVDGGGNRVLEPGEPAALAPGWRNDGVTAHAGVSGTLSSFDGPPGGTYTIDDGEAAYGDVAPGATVTCSADCYVVTAAGTPRPAQHWDTTLDETLSLGNRKNWTLHVGASFDDVAADGPFYRFVETLLHRGVTGGCGGMEYCPSTSTTREQMAAFVLVAREGAGYVPAACAPPGLFADVPATSPFCRFVEELANRAVVSGCAPGLYCPASAVTREQMAIFVLRTLDGALDPPACVAGGEMFADVPAGSPFCRWVEELARRGVVSGCAAGEYCPSDPVTREQMGVFLSVTFGLSLYGA